MRAVQLCCQFKKVSPGMQQYARSPSMRGHGDWVRSDRFLLTNDHNQKG